MVNLVITADCVEHEILRLEEAVKITADYFRRKEDAKFEDAFAKLE